MLRRDNNSMQIHEDTYVWNLVSQLITFISPPLKPCQLEEQNDEDFRHPLPVMMTIQYHRGRIIVEMSLILKTACSSSFNIAPQAV